MIVSAHNGSHQYLLLYHKIQAMVPIKIKRGVKKMKQALMMMEVHQRRPLLFNMIDRTGLRVSEAWGYLVVRGLFCPRQS